MTAEPVEPQWLVDIEDEAFCRRHGIAWGQTEHECTRVTVHTGGGHLIAYLLGVLIIAAGLFTSLVTPHLSGGTILAALLITAGGGICVRVAIVAGRAS